MNSRISGVIIAVSAAVAGSLVPSTVEAYLGNKYIIALGLGAIVALNTAIALLHILDRGKPSPVQEAETRGSGRRAEPQESTSRPVLAASNTAVHTKRSRVVTPEQRNESDTATPSQPQP
jgi:hypothetical protein